MAAVQLTSTGSLKSKIIEGFHQYETNVGLCLGLPNMTNIKIHTYYHTERAHHTFARRESLTAESRRLGEMREALNL